MGSETIAPAVAQSEGVAAGHDSGPRVFHDAVPRVFHDAADPRRANRALTDLSLGFRRWRLAAALAWLDIRNRYRGSVLGPFWLTLSTGLMLAGLGILYSALLHQTLRSYLPFLSVSLIVWNMISQIVTDATTSLISAEGMIRQLPLPYTTHALRCVFRNVITAAHNLPLIVVVLAVTGAFPGPGVVLAVVGLAVLGINAFAAALLLGMLCARFRDLGQIVNSVMQLAFFMTPILWQPSSLGRRAWLLLFDPFYSVMQIVRGPLLGTGASTLVWVSALTFTVLMCGVTYGFFVRFRGRIAFWV
ncbi:MAG: ABC transporter permease [Rhodospirillales bacterium]|nr:ABC transporter permease [Rhodospirillales bacterium]